MNRKNQFERTDRDITNALLAVMERKSFEKISVQDILDEALINRATFYLHFPDKYSVLERLQAKTLAGLTDRVAALNTAGEKDLSAVSQLLFDFLSENQAQMLRLLSIRVEGFDLQQQMRDFFSAYLAQIDAPLSGLERDLLSGMIMEFMVCFLKEKRDPREFPSAILDAWLNMSLYFFRVNQMPEAREKLLGLIGELHQ